MTKDEVTDALFDAIEDEAGHEVELTDTFHSLGLDSLDKFNVELKVENMLGYSEEDKGPLLNGCEISDTIEQIIEKTCQKLGV